MTAENRVSDPLEAALGWHHCQKGPLVNPKLEQHTDAVRALIRRAQQVFGSDVTPIEPPVLSADCDLEDNLGRGHF